MKRAKIDDIAREAGVSRATVDRVIHGRVNVRSETAQKVAAAARRLGFYATGLIDRSLEKPLPRSLGNAVMGGDQEGGEGGGLGVRGGIHSVRPCGVVSAAQVGAPLKSCKC